MHRLKFYVVGQELLKQPSVSARAAKVESMQILFWRVINTCTSGAAVMCWWQETGKFSFKSLPDGSLDKTKLICIYC